MRVELGLRSFAKIESDGPWMQEYGGRRRRKRCAMMQMVAGGELGGEGMEVAQVVSVAVTLSGSTARQQRRQ